MQATTYIAFITVSTAVIVFPGPSILLIVANSLQQGVGVGLATVVGGLAAMAIQLAIAIVGLGSLVELLNVSFELIRWAGTLYLFWLGVQRWQGAPPISAADEPAKPGYRRAITQGFIVALTNPGTMLFFVAFLPQFISTGSDSRPQLLLLAASFLALCALFDSGYAMLASRVGQALYDPQHRGGRHRIAGATLIIAAIVLAVAGVPNI